MIDLIIILPLPYRFISLLLRYSDTRVFSVVEKSEGADSENEIVLIEKVLLYTKF
jgi:hypothetical protein